MEREVYLPFFYLSFLFVHISGVEGRLKLPLNKRKPQFSVLRLEYPLGGSSKKGSHVYFLLIVAMVLLL